MLFTLGLAGSKSWVRLDDLAGIKSSSEGWDSEAQVYPFAARHQGKWYMFYNGNSFGRDGIGLAIAG